LLVFLLIIAPAGIEPAHGGTKNLCLTTWPRGNRKAVAVTGAAMGAVGFEPTNPKERSYSPSRLARLRYTPVYLYDYNSISRLVPLCNHFFNFSPFPNHQFRNSQASEKLTIAGLGLMQLT
jgi:hypothetical protein